MDLNCSEPSRRWRGARAPLHLASSGARMPKTGAVVSALRLFFDVARGWNRGGTAALTAPRGARAAISRAAM
jgi:hypothetical protein